LTPRSGGVEGSQVDEFGEGASLDHAAAVEHEDQIGATDLGNLVRNDHEGAIG
jgi:hypothetical protein